MLFDSARYVCSCDNHFFKSSDIIGSPSLSYPLGALYFCPACQMIRCEGCSEVKVESKYCARCMTDYSSKRGQTRCSKNCFECPKCTSPMDVKSQDEESEEGRGKRFMFKCVYCPFTYQTKLITRPASLQAILRREFPDEHAKVVAKYTAMYSLNHQHNEVVFHDKDPVAARLRAMKIKEMGSLDEVHQLKQTIASNGPIDLEQPVPGTRAQPQAAKLASKFAVRCADCNTELSSPVPDVRSMKLLTKHVAADVIPQLVATCEANASELEPGSDIPCSLSIINNLSSSINVIISIYGTVSTALTPAHITMSLPMSNVTVKGRKEKAKVMETIPTVLLGHETKAAKAEQVLRVGQRQQTDEGYLEHGHNWATIPFTICIDEAGITPQFPITVPFHIEVETKVPEPWKPISAKRGLKFRFWVLTQINVT